MKYDCFFLLCVQIECLHGDNNNNILFLWKHHEINIFFQAFDPYASSDLMFPDDDPGLRIESFEE